jgi:hypothetical protein
MAVDHMTVASLGPLSTSLEMLFSDSSSQLFLTQSTTANTHPSSSRLKIDNGSPKP